MSNNQEQEAIHKHLEFIQVTITRMAANSFIIKGWAVTLVVAILAFSADKEKVPSGAWIALIPTVIFWGLDAYFLRQERLFRELYEEVRTKDKTDYSLNTLPFQDQVKSWLYTIPTPTLGFCYGSLVVVIILIAFL